MSAREEVLARVRQALGKAPASAGQAEADLDGAAGRRYRVRSDLGSSELPDLLTRRLTDYGSRVRQCVPAELAATVAAALAGRGARRLVVPPGLDLPGVSPAQLTEGTEWIVDDGLSAVALDAFDGVITTATLAVAETGTIVLDGSPGQGRRALSLIPDYHLCVLYAGQVVGLVPQALPLLRPDRPLTWISGPSATSDIELDRVEGVHGPRTLEVILVV